MVKKTKTEPQAGWGAPPPADNAHVAEGSTLFPEGNGNISDDPENRQPPLDEGWDESKPPSPMAMPAAGIPPENDPGTPAPEPEKPKKGKGSKSKPADEQVKTTPKAKGGNADGQLISFVERLERLDEERKTVTDDMKEVVSEAKAAGYDTAILKKVIARRKRGYDAVMEEEALIETYQNAVGWDD